jgi:hypothetical protein
MRDLIDLIEEARPITSVDVDQLPASAKADILDMFQSDNGPPAFEEFWMADNGIMSFNDTYISQFIFGDENLNVQGEGGGLFMVNCLTLDPRVLYSPRRSVSDLAVDKYAAMTTKAPPVLVRKVSKGWKLVEGGHRLAAAVKRGDTSIDAIDVSVFFNMTVEDWREL